jgi:hypothetical protein
VVPSDANVNESNVAGGSTAVELKVTPLVKEPFKKHRYVDPLKDTAI